MALPAYWQIRQILSLSSTGRLTSDYTEIIPYNTPVGDFCGIATSSFCFLRLATHLPRVLRCLPQPVVLAAHTLIQPLGKVSRQAQSADQVLHIRQVAQGAKQQPSTTVRGARSASAGRPC